MAGAGRIKKNRTFVDGWGWLLIGRAKEELFRGEFTGQACASFVLDMRGDVEIAVRSSFMHEGFGGWQRL